MLSKIIIISLYLVSVYCAYKFIQLAYSKGGIYEILKINALDIFCTLMPLFNLGYAFSYLTGSYKKDNQKLNKFFKVEK